MVLMNNKKHKNKITEQELLDTIDVITKKLAYKFKFGYHQIEDMKQQISIFALEGLENYDNKRPLENFLWTHVRNRLFNFKRDNYQRPDKPCKTCPFYDPNLKKSDNQCSEFKNKNDCELYHNWFGRNSSKKNLMHLTTIEEIKDYLPHTYDCVDNVSNKEIIDKIQLGLTGDIRKIYLKMQSGIKICKSDMEKLVNAIKEILDA
jgi:hypothetical protein